MISKLFSKGKPDNAILKQCKDAFQKGLAALGELQLSDGGFPLNCWSKGTVPRDAHTLFSTACVLLAAGSHLPRGALLKAGAFIISNRRIDETWEFDPSLRIPSDSDDTAVALAALARFKLAGVSEKDSLVLRSFWREPNGPFRTWKADWYWEQAARDDAVVNGNVLVALKEVGGSPTDVEIDAAWQLIQSSHRESRYYCSLHSISYSAVRAGFSFEKLHSTIRKCPRLDRNSLGLAQWVTVANVVEERAIRQLLRNQGGSGIWPEEAWVTGMMKPKLYWGSSAVTTAFCLEALHKYLNATA